MEPRNVPDLYFTHQLRKVFAFCRDVCVIESTHVRDQILKSKTFSGQANRGAVIF